MGIVCKTHQGPLTMFVQVRRFVDFWVGILIAKSTKKDREKAKSQLADSSGAGVSESFPAGTDGDAELHQNHAEHAERQCLSPCPHQSVASVPTRQPSCHKGQAPPAPPGAKLGRYRSIFTPPFKKKIGET